MLIMVVVPLYLVGVDENVDDNNDGMGDCLQTCSYGNVPLWFLYPLVKVMLLFMSQVLKVIIVNVKTDCEQTGCGI